SGQVNANGNVTMNGTLDTNDQFFEFEGSTFANNGAVTSSTGGFGEIDFIGVGDVASTMQTISGTGSYSGGVSFPVEIHVNNSATLAPASGTILNNVRNLFLSTGSVLSLPNVLVFQNGTVTSAGGSTISGAHGLQTKNTTTLSLSGTTTALVEIVNGTTTCAGNFGPITIDAGATLFQNGTCTIDGDLMVNGTMDINDQFAVFQGGTSTNDGAMISSTPNGIFEFDGLNGASATSQNVAGNGTYNTNGRIDFSTLNNTTVNVAAGAIIEGVFNNTIASGSTFNNGGTTAPGFPPGQANFSGKLQLGSTSNLAFDIGGTGQGTTYDLFNKTDSAAQTLGGSLVVELINNFTPASGDTFTILTTQTTLQGAFSNVASGGRLATADGHGSFLVTYGSQNNVVLSNFVAGVAGSKVTEFSTLAQITANRVIFTSTFTINGTASTQVLIRGLGPSLGISGEAPATSLQLLNQSGATIASNAGWQLTQKAAILATGLAPSSSRESAILITLVPGSYTVILGGSGIGKIDAHDLSPSANSALSIGSSIGFAGTGTSTLSGDFTIGAGSGNTSVLIRVLGPSVTGAPGAVLLDPTLELDTSSGSQILFNDDWQTTQKTQILATGLAPTDSRESAIVANLAPGTYNFVVRGKSGKTGYVRAEVYQLQSSQLPLTYNGHTYMLTSSAESWTAAEAEAVSKGGHLIAINNSAENAFVVSSFLQGGFASEPLWIGLTDIPPGGPGAGSKTYTKWTTGESVTYTNWNTATGEPNNASPGEDYGAINWHHAWNLANPAGTWNDAPNNGTSGYGGNTNGPYFGIIEIPHL
ncbi:MAG TPA: C-type lectin domain-containing protein, partial [Chthoniobacterales bacterium]|nr:C-type lectin domain-containing protein [Chthoniobacterales bacterium]